MSEINRYLMSSFWIKYSGWYHFHHCWKPPPICMNILSHLAFSSWLQRIFCCPLECWPMQEKHSRRIKHSLLLMRSEFTICRICKWFNGYLTDRAWYSAIRNNMFKHKRELCRLHTLDCDDEFSPDFRLLTKVIIFIMTYHHVHLFHHVWNF